MLCEKFKCVNLTQNEDTGADECVHLGTGCIEDMCEAWGECINCQGQDAEPCEGQR